MNERQLETFAAVARERSFSEAARKMFVSQPSVSYQIKELETELGVTLFKRSRSHVEPTEAGARLAELVPETLEGLTRIRSEMTAFRNGGACVVGCTTFMFNTDSDFFTTLFTRIQREAPNARVQMRLLNADDGMKRVDAEELSAAVQSFPCGSRPPRRFGSTLFTQVRVYVMVSRHGSLAHRSRLSPSDIRGRTAYVCRDDLSSTPVVLRDVQKACDVGLRIEEVDSFSVIPALVGGGNGISLTTVPTPYSSIVYVPLEAPVSYDIRLVWLQKRENDAIRMVARTFEQAFRAHTPGMNDF